MDQLSQNLPGVIALALIVGICAFAGIRVGPRFLIQRIAGVIFVLFGVTFITFILGYFAPGNAVLTQTGGHASQQTIHALEHFYGFDLPWYEQYARFVNRLLHFNLGYSYIDRTQSVAAILSRYVPISAQLGITAVVLAVLVGVPLGLYAAVRANSRYDTVIQSTSLVFYALPTFVLIPIYQLIMITLHEDGLPSLAVTGWDSWDAMVGPILIFGAGIFAFFLRITRASMLEVLRQDYVRTARAKGLSERRVIWLHAFRNSTHQSADRDRTGAGLCRRWGLRRRGALQHSRNRHCEPYGHLQSRLPGRAGDSHSHCCSNRFRQSDDRHRLWIGRPTHQDSVNPSCQSDHPGVDGLALVTAIASIGGK